MLTRTTEIDISFPQRSTFLTSQVSSWSRYNQLVAFLIQDVSDLASQFIKILVCLSIKLCNYMHYAVLMNYHDPLTLRRHCFSVRERNELKRELKCHSFRWFLENVYPELKVPDAGDMAFGSIQQVRRLTSQAPGLMTSSAH